MKEYNDSRLDKILSTLEFPGEQRYKIEEYLNRRCFTDEVMKKVLARNHKMNRVLAWGLVVLFDFVLLSFLGTNGGFVREYFFLNPELYHFFFVSLSLSFLVGLSGLILNVDTTWMSSFDIKNVNDYFRNKARRIGARFFK
jgi:hypothetical protein